MILGNRLQRGERAQVEITFGFGTAMARDAVGREERLNGLAKLIGDLNLRRLGRVERARKQRQPDDQ